MKKYLGYFKQCLYDYSAYKIRFVILIFSQAVSPLVIMFVLYNLSSTENSVMSKDQIITYYLFTSVLYIFMRSSIDGFLKAEIKEGGLAGSLIKPLGYWKLIFIRDLSFRLVKFLAIIPFLLIFLILSTNINFEINLINIFYVSTSLVITYLIASFFAMSVGFLTFFLEEIWGIQNLKHIVVLLLGGVALPYEFFPESFRNFLVYTPFPYLVNWPLRYGYSGNLALEYVSALFWMFALLYLSLFVWNQGLKKYSGMGTF